MRSLSIILAYSVAGFCLNSEVWNDRDSHDSHGSGCRGLTPGILGESWWAHICGSILRDLSWAKRRSWFHSKKNYWCTSKLRKVNQYSNRIGWWSSSTKGNNNADGPKRDTNIHAFLIQSSGRCHRSIKISPSDKSPRREIIIIGLRSLPSLNVFSPCENFSPSVKKF